MKSQITIRMNCKNQLAHTQFDELIFDNFLPSDSKNITTCFKIFLSDSPYPLLRTIMTAVCIIRNKNSITKRWKGDTSIMYSLSAAEAAINGVNLSRLLSNSVRLKGDKLSISDIRNRNLTLDLTKYGKIYLIGAGKGSVPMTSSLLAILQHKRSPPLDISGSIITPYGTSKKIDKVVVFEAGHPLPDANSIKGAKGIIGTLKRTNPSDLVFVLLSGGGSSLLSFPVKGITLHDKRHITRALLASGATIKDLNIVRKHISRVKGGKLVQYSSPGTTFLTILVSDVIGDEIQTIASGPTFTGDSSFMDAKKVLTKYDMWRTDNPPLRRIREVINNGIKIELTSPQIKEFRRTEYALIGNNNRACDAAACYLRSRNISTLVLGSHYGGDAAEQGKWLSQLAKELETMKMPFAVVLGGETTVRLNKGRANGIGGRNQEAALSALLSLEISPRENISICCIGTDGVDGNSAAAGAVVSAKMIRTYERFSKGYLNKFLENHDSSSAFRILGSQIFTGKTLTNVNDVNIICRLTT